MSYLDINSSLGNPGPIKVMLIYDDILSEITGVKSEEAWVSEGLGFTYFLMFFFGSYPGIKEKYPPGVLGFSVNGIAPSEFLILQDGDKIRFFVHS